MTDTTKVELVSVKFGMEDVVLSICIILIVTGAALIIGPYGPDTLFQTMLFGMISFTIMFVLIEGAEPKYTRKDHIIGSLLTGGMTGVPVAILTATGNIWGGSTLGGINFTIGILLVIALLVALSKDNRSACWIVFGVLCLMSLTTAAWTAFYIPANRLINVGNGLHYTSSVEFHLPWEHKRNVFEPELSAKKTFSVSSAADVWEATITYSVQNPQELNEEQWSKYSLLQENEYSEAFTDGADPALSLREKFLSQYPFLDAVVTVTHVTTTSWTAPS